MSAKENIRSILDEFEYNIKQKIIETIEPVVKQLETQYDEVLHENVRLNFELDEYKAIVSELRIYEICWKKFKPVADVTLSNGREQLDQLAKPKLGSK